MKDIHEVKDNQPLSFNHVRCRGVAARAGSVHLIYRKLGRKGGARTRPQHHHPVPQGGPFSKKFPPPEVHLKSTNNAHNRWHSPHNTLPAWVEQVHIHTINNLSHIESLSSSALQYTWVLHLMNWAGLEGLCQASGGGRDKRSKVTPREGARTLQGPLAMHSSRT